MIRAVRVFSARNGEPDSAESFDPEFYNLLLTTEGLVAGCDSLVLKSIKRSVINIDMVAKRHKNHKNKISGLVISMSYNE